MSSRASNAHASRRRPLTNCYAQTNIQLYNQLAETGYPPRDIAQVHRSYALGADLFSGAFRGCGRPFLTHLVGTASVLASVQAPTNVVAAGLLHATYTHGEFGDGRRGRTDFKRQAVRTIVGNDVEDLIARYTELRWTRDGIPQVAAAVETLRGADRYVLLMRLANEVDDLTDLAPLYDPALQRELEFIGSFLPLYVDMAVALGYPVLANELTTLFEDVVAREFDPALRGRQAGSYFLAPASHTWRMPVRLRRLTARISQQYRRIRRIPAYLGRLL